MRQVRPRTRASVDHSCFLLYPEEDVSFRMEVRQGENCINVSPVTANGIDAQFMSDEARQLVETWAKEEALRVCFS